MINELIEKSEKMSALKRELDLWAFWYHKNEKYNN